VDGGYWFLDLVCSEATGATSKKLMLNTTTRDGKRVRIEFGEDPEQVCGAGL
jgi:hypothetical protein